jgi:beta-phosphoglucomutase family hydrolase
MLGLPDGIKVFLFDLDGVLTQTAKVHASAWKEMFDEYLHSRSAQTGEPFVPFDSLHDYDRYVDGRPRYDGVRTFLAARDITLGEGTPDDPPSAETVCGLGNRKNDIVQEMIRRDGVETYEGSVRYVQAARNAGIPRAVVTSSANAREVLNVTGLSDLFDTIVDGNTIAGENLKGKPAPDTFVYGAHALGVKPRQAAVFEDALAGVEAGRAGAFGYVVGVDRVGQAEALREHGADVVVKDLAELLETA